MSEALAAGQADTISLIQKILPALVPLGLKILWALVLLFIGRKLIGLCLKLFSAAAEKTGMDHGLSLFLKAFIQAALYLLLVFIVAGEVGFNTASIIALLGSAMLAIGMSLQGSLANFAGSIVILMTRPFGVGDYIISSHGEGTVKEIGLVYTVVDTMDNKRISIPNGTLANDPVTNVTAHAMRRLDLKVGIGYGADLGKAKEALSELFRKNDLILKDQPVRIVADELGDSSVNLICIGWVKTGDYLTAKWQLTEEIKLCLDRAGIEIPFPQVDVHMRKD